MTDHEPLDEPPAIELEVVEDHTAETGPAEGFLRVRRVSLRNRHPDGHTSRVYRYDLIERDAMDAVGIVLEAEGDEPRVCLRSALRPPMRFRDRYAIPLPPDDRSHVLWEVPAGLVEPHERGEAGLRGCASRETLEEVGLEVAPERFDSLGPPVALSPGVLGEKLHFLHAVVDPSRRGVPLEDGSPTEERAAIRFVPLREALAATRDGRIQDVKTEVALRRLAERRGLA